MGDRPAALISLGGGSGLGVGRLKAFQMALGDIYADAVLAETPG